MIGIHDNHSRCNLVGTTRCFCISWTLLPITHRLEQRRNETNEHHEQNEHRNQCVLTQIKQLIIDSIERVEHQNQYFAHLFRPDSSSVGSWLIWQWKDGGRDSVMMMMRRKSGRDQNKRICGKRRKFANGPGRFGNKVLQGGWDRDWGFHFGMIGQVESLSSDWAFGLAQTVSAGQSLFQELTAETVVTSQRPFADTKIGDS